MFWHLTLASSGRRPLVQEERLRRLIIQRIAQVAGSELILFCVVDDHIHLVAWCLRRRAGKILQATQLALRPLLQASLEARPIKPVESRRYLLWLVRYVLTQPEHHDLVGAHPALYSGSCFQDLAGARLVPGLGLKLGAALPRYRLRTVYQHVGLPLGPVQPLELTAIRALGPARIVAAVAASQAVGPDLRGKHALHVRARRTVVTLGISAGLPLQELSAVLSLSGRTARKARALPPDAAYLTAARIRLALEEAAVQPALECASG